MAEVPQEIAKSKRPERLSDQERQLLVRLLLNKLATEGCAADPVYTALLRKLSGVDTAIWVEVGG